MIRATFFAVLMSLILPSASGQNDPGIKTAVAAAKELGENAKISAAALLQNEKGVSQEVRRGVARLVSACSPNDKSRPPGVAPDKSVEYIERKLQSAATQDENFGKRLAEISRAAQTAKESKCGATFIPFMRSNACQASQELIASLTAIQTSLQSYNSLLQERYKLYKEVANKEAEGCVRKGFTERLLRANDDHMNEQEEVARIKFQDLLNQADEIVQQLRP